MFAFFSKFIFLCLAGMLLSDIFHLPSVLIIDSFINVTDLSTSAGATNCCKQQIGKSTGVSFSCCLPPTCANVFPPHTWKYFVVFPPVNIAFNLEIYNWDLEFTLPEYFNKAYSCTIFSGKDLPMTSSDSMFCVSCLVFGAIYNLKWECARASLTKTLTLMAS